MVFWLMSIIEAYGIGSNCWPRRLKFKMMKWKCTWSQCLPSEHTFITSDSYFNVRYQFGQCKVNEGCISPTVVRKNFYFSIFHISRTSGVIDTLRNKLYWSTEVESYLNYLAWNKLNWTYLQTLPVIPKGVKKKKWKIWMGGGVNDYGILRTYLNT